MQSAIGRYQVGDRVDVVWRDQRQHQRRLPGRVIGRFSSSGNYRYRVRLDDGRAILCWAHQLRAEDDLPPGLLSWWSDRR